MSPSPQETPPVPRLLADLLTPDWLTRALDARFPGIRVTRVTTGPVVSRITTNARFRIECADGLPEGLSPDLCVKGYFTEGSWASRRVGEYEVLFYRDLAAATGVRTLRVVHADIDRATRHGIVITEDVLAQGGRFLDATDSYTPEQAAQSLSQFARLHAATWGDPVIGATDWLAPRLASHLLVRGVNEIRGNFESEIGAGVPEAVRDPERLVAAYAKLADLTSTASPWSVVHGDAHVGNVYLDGAGRPCLLDWQVTQRGPWYLDIGYHIASALTVADRRRTERDLLRHYLDELRAAGIEPPSWDEAWLGMRRGIVHGFFMWGITLKVNPAITTVLQHRLGTATADHDCFAAVGA